MSELTFYIVALVISCVAFGVMWYLGGKELENYVELPDRESRYVRGGCK